MFQSLFTLTVIRECFRIKVSVAQTSEHAGSLFVKNNYNFTLILIFILAINGGQSKDTLNAYFPKMDLSQMHFVFFFYYSFICMILIIIALNL